MSILIKIKGALKNSRAVYATYLRLKTHCANFRLKMRIHGKYVFENRAQDREKLCIVLAGYKEFLYPAVFGRLKRFAPENMDVCILTSGLYSPKISEICAENHWSYLSTEKNNVCLIQNLAINVHPHADYIFKLDEDMFITENYFDNMMAAYEHAWQGHYRPGVIAPLIPLNCYGYVRILEKLNLISMYEHLFERPFYAAGNTWQLEANPEAACFFWGKDGHVPHIDRMNAQFSLQKREERPCAIRFSIGAILFRRELWQQMGYFPVNYYLGKGTGMGQDETFLCRYCCLASRPLMVSENIVVGHLSFTLQNAAMKDYYLNHTEEFLPPQ